MTEEKIQQAKESADRLKKGFPDNTFFIRWNYQLEKYEVVSHDSVSENIGEVGDLIYSTK